MIYPCPHAENSKAFDCPYLYGAVVDTFTTNYVKAEDGATVPDNLQRFGWYIYPDEEV